MQSVLRLVRLALPLLITLPASAMAPSDEPGSGSSGGITEIVVERTACFGACPVDTLVLRDNGKATYAGKANTRLSGEFASELRKGSFDTLARWLATEGFFQLKDSYGSPNVDTPDEVIRVTRGGERKIVTNHSLDYSLKLWGMGNVIRAVVADTQWQPANSGIRGQALLKQAGDDWRPRPAEDVWVWFADMRQRVVTSTDREGRFEINLAPGTYSVLWQGVPQAVVVMPGRFTEVDLRQDVAAAEVTRGNAEIAAGYPPPHPEDGLYRLASGSPAKWTLWQDQTMVMLGDRTAPTILEKRLESDSVDNSTFQLRLILSYDATVNSASHALIVGGRLYKQFGSISRGREISGVLFRITGEEQATAVAAYFNLTPGRFNKPDYRIRMSLIPTKQSFRRGEPVTATLQILNAGTGPIEFSEGEGFNSRRDDYAFAARRNGKAVTDISFPGERGGKVIPRGLAPGATFTDTVDLGKWFEFKETGSYDIHGSYRMNFLVWRNPATSPQVTWSENTEADFVVNIE